MKKSGKVQLIIVMHTKSPLVTILIPNYKTLELAKLCLRSLRRFTDPDKAKIVVIDNDSADASLDYLRSLPWITLIERKNVAYQPPAIMHASALDAGLELADTPYVLSIHTDTIVTSADWLQFLLKQITADENIAAVGSWKLEHKPLIKRFGKKLEKWFQTAFWFPLTGRGNGAIAGRGPNHYYLRSHCALYRTKLLRKFECTFSEGNETAGKALHRKLLNNGYRMLFIPTDELSKIMKHFNHATMVLNPEIAGKKTGKPSAFKRIMREMQSVDYKTIISDYNFDQ